MTVSSATGGPGAEIVGVDCPGTQRALGGGGTASSHQIDRSAPLKSNSTSELAGNGDTPTGWLIEYQNIPNGETATVYVICAP